MICKCYCFVKEWFDGSVFLEVCVAYFRQPVGAGRPEKQVGCKTFGRPVAHARSDRFEFLLPLSLRRFYHIVYDLVVTSWSLRGRCRRARCVLFHGMLSQVPAGGSVWWWCM